MLRFGSIIGFSALLIAFSAMNAQAQRVSCTYDSCMAACQKAGGGNRQGGCSAYCDKTLKDRKLSGVCK